MQFSTFVILFLIPVAYWVTRPETCVAIYRIAYGQTIEAAHRIVYRPWYLSGLVGVRIGGILFILAVWYLELTNHPEVAVYAMFACVAISIFTMIMFWTFKFSRTPSE
jgi:hypothetical protein